TCPAIQPHWRAMQPFWPRRATCLRRRAPWICFRIRVTSRQWRCSYPRGRKLMANDKLPAADALQDLLRIMRRLRDPARGCPWDLEQNFASIAPHTLEEVYEVIDAIET